MTTGKKLIRKVKKGTSGMSKSDINALAMASGGQTNLTGNATSSKSHHKNNMTLQQQPSGFNGSGQAIGISSTRVLSGNSNSAGAAGIKTQTLKNYSSTQNLSKTGLNNIRLKQLVQLQTKAIQGINSVQSTKH